MRLYLCLFVFFNASWAFGSEDQARVLATQLEGFVLKYKDEVKLYHDSGGRLTDEFDPFFALLLYECELLVPENQGDFKEISLDDRMLSVQLIRGRTSIILMAAGSVFADSNNYRETNDLLRDWRVLFIALNNYEKSIIKRAMED